MHVHHPSDDVPIPAQGGIRGILAMDQLQIVDVDAGVKAGDAAPTLYATFVSNGVAVWASATPDTERIMRTIAIHSV
eukprot:CAMPEP_0118921238 /NCGR_PEP_ID=MMETSP1169-20130426/587_1 /TAXON_ID=36882 /ORGANISM="Pyramimonas obovata, Strain CCMP722" /LENGTH=76 /DNA_ID=CAMNT_0006861931 /DNA_START=191 /DNA_END=422 /DNA_ORIENTATION=-